MILCKIMPGSEFLTAAVMVLGTALNLFATDEQYTMCGETNVSKLM